MWGKLPNEPKIRFLWCVMQPTINKEADCSYSLPQRISFRSSSRLEIGYRPTTTTGLFEDKNVWLWHSRVQICFSVSSLFCECQKDQTMCKTGRFYCKESRFLGLKLNERRTLDEVVAQLSHLPKDFGDSIFFLCVCVCFRKSQICSSSDIQYHLFNPIQSAVSKFIKHECLLVWNINPSIKAGFPPFKLLLFSHLNTPPLPPPE